MQRARDDKAKDLRKQHILEAAEQIIRTQGLEQLNIAAVAKKVKLAVGTIYLYFPKKEDIIAHLTIKSREILLEKFKKSTAQSENALEQIHHLLAAYFRFYKEHLFYHELVSFYESNAGLEEPEELLQASRNITDFVVEILNKGQVERHIRADLDAQEFSFLLWGTVVGVIQLINVKAGPLQAQLHKSPEAFFETYIDLIVKSLRV